MPQISLPLLQPTQAPKFILVYTGDLDKDIAAIGTKQAALNLVGGLSAPSKMPCSGYSIPASKCKTGAKLKSVKDSVCYSCYAADDSAWLTQGKHRGMYALPNVRNALERRFQALMDPLWVPAMVMLIKGSKSGYFRWHDSGDIQSVEHLANIGLVAANTSTIKHWLPTREFNIVQQWQQQYSQPANLVIRVSAHMVDTVAPTRFSTSSAVISDITKVSLPATAQECKAYTNDNKCGTCRACWDSTVPLVWYHKH